MLNIKEINNIYDFMKKTDNKEDKNLFRGSKRTYRNYKYENNSNKNDILLLRDSTKDNKYNELNNNNINDEEYYYREPLSNEY